MRNPKATLLMLAGCLVGALSLLLDTDRPWPYVIAWMASLLIVVAIVLVALALPSNMVNHTDDEASRMPRTDLSTTGTTRA